MNAAFAAQILLDYYHCDASINARFAPYTVDMETASVAHVCYVNQKPFIAVRTVVDTPEHSGLAAFEANCAQTSKKSAAFVRDMLRLGKWNDK